MKNTNKKPSKFIVNNEKTEVKRGRLYHKGKLVYKGKRGFPDYVFNDGRFAMTLTYYDAMKKILRRFKTTTLK